MASIETKTVRLLSRPGDWIGAEAFANNSTYTRTTLANASTVLYGLSRSSYATIADSVSVQMGNIPLFSSIQEPIEFAAFCTIEKFRPDRVVAKKSQINESIYFVCKGCVYMTSNNKEFCVGSYFGEECALDPKMSPCWSSDIIAKTDVVILIIDQEGFTHPTFSCVRNEIEAAFEYQEPECGPNIQRVLSLDGSVISTRQGPVKCDNASIGSGVSEPTSAEVEEQTALGQSEQQKSCVMTALEADSGAFSNFPMLVCQEAQINEPPATEVVNPTANKLNEVSSARSLSSASVTSNCTFGTACNDLSTDAQFAAAVAHLEN